MKDHAADPFVLFKQDPGQTCPLCLRSKVGTNAKPNRQSRLTRISLITEELACKVTTPRLNFQSLSLA